jgi:hypothetical protein
MTLGTNYFGNYTFNIYPQGTTGEKGICVDGTMVNTSGISYGSFFGTWVNSTTATSFSMLPSTGNFSGTIYLYTVSLI